MVPKPQHQWNLNEDKGLYALDSTGTVNGKLTPNVKRVSVIPFRVGAVHIDGSDDSFVSFGPAVGQFGTHDFTIALWFKTSETYRYFDIIGNRTDGSHGNFFCIRMTGKHESWPEGMITAEIDENGNNYVMLNSQRTGLNDGQWHHVAVTRAGSSLMLYVDGFLSAAGTASGAANISNGNEFKLGRSLIGVHDKFAPDAEYHSIYIFDVPLNNTDILSLIPRNPVHRWKLDEKDGLVAHDVIGKVDGNLTPSVQHIPGGPLQPFAVHLDGNDNSFIDFGSAVGQFGEKDFSVTFWLNTKETYRYFDLVGNRTDGSNGIFFCVRMTGIHESEPEGMLTSEVDNNGKNYISLTSAKHNFNDGKWHLIAVVRKENKLSIYVDGNLMDEDKAAGIANICNSNSFRLGRSLKGVTDRFTPVADFSDLRIYDAAVTNDEILSLIPIP